jgi:hypothetical protein
VLTYFVNDFEMVPVAPIITGITVVFTFHVLLLLLLLLLYYQTTQEHIWTLHHVPLQYRTNTILMSSTIPKSPAQLHSTTFSDKCHLYTQWRRTLVLRPHPSLS